MPAVVPKLASIWKGGYRPNIFGLVLFLRTVFKLSSAFSASPNLAYLLIETVAKGRHYDFKF